MGLILLVVGGFLIGGAWSLATIGRRQPIAQAGRTRKAAQAAEADNRRRGRQALIFAGVLTLLAAVAIAAGILRLI
ncbi:MAG: hypothetical protein ACR2JQ_03585 [Mycobacteriales bacterium]